MVLQTRLPGAIQWRSTNVQCKVRSGIFRRETGRHDSPHRVGYCLMFKFKFEENAGIKSPLPEIGIVNVNRTEDHGMIESNVNVKIDINRADSPR